jgi:hypothetical protein
MKHFWVGMAVACAAWASVEAQAPAEAATNAAAVAVSTNVPAGGTNQAMTLGTAMIPEAAQEWVGYVRVLRGGQGEVRAVRLVSDDKLVAVDMNAKAQELAAVPKTRKMLVKGTLDVRDGRAWLVVSEFKDAPDLPAAALEPIPPPAAATNTPPVAVTNTAPAAVSTNAPAVTNAPAAAPAP